MGKRYADIIIKDMDRGKIYSTKQDELTVDLRIHADGLLEVLDIISLKGDEDLQDIKHAPYLCVVEDFKLRNDE